jgi:hypothetical protein
MRLAFAALAFAIVASAQDDVVDQLIKKLSSSDYEEQGRAAKRLEEMGPAILPKLRAAQKVGGGDERMWLDRLVAKLSDSEAHIKKQIEKLASADDEEKDAAAAELKKIGRPAVPYLVEAKNSDNKNLRLRATKLLAEMGGDIVDAPPAGGGKFGQRLGGKRALVARGGGGAETEDAVLAALKWLSRHQNEDGSWAMNVTRRCGRVAKYGDGKCAPNPGSEDLEVGVTGLALLAFLGAGYTHLSKDTHDGITFGDVVRKGVDWLLQQQDREGCIGSRANQKYMYNHAIAAGALVEAFGMTGEAKFKAEAQKAVDFTVAAQNPGKGWRYSFRCGDNDSSVTGWCVAALHGAELADLKVPKKSFEGAAAWFSDVTDDVWGRTGYTHKGTGKVFVPGMNEEFSHHEALSAIAMLCRRWMDPKSDTKAADLLVRDLPSWEEKSRDYYYWYYATLALYAVDGPSGKSWKKWNESLKEALVKNQNPLGCAAGSWEPTDRWAGEGGRVYATALNALTLETYYRYAVTK